jgi:hypothetical protein
LKYLKIRGISTPAGQGRQSPHPVQFIPGLPLFFPDWDREGFSSPEGNGFVFSCTANYFKPADIYLPINIGVRMSAS